jgi:hypothetical protein
MMQKPEAVERASPEDIAILSMEFGRLLMECGASARIVDDIVGRVADQTLIISVQDALRVMFTIGAMGTGLAIPSMLLRVRRFNELQGMEPG